MHYILCSDVKTLLLYFNSVESHQNPLHIRDEQEKKFGVYIMYNASVWMR